MTFIYFLCLIYLYYCQKCQPLYWEVDPKYQLNTNQIQTFASTAIINIPDLETDYGSLLNKSHYYIQNVLTKITIDRTNKQVNINQNKISVSGIKLNCDFEYDAIINGSKKYNGKGKSSLTNISIGFSKQFVLKNGNAVFDLVTADISPINPIKIQQFIPNITNTQIINNFNQFINHDLYNELKNLLEKIYIISLDQNLKNQSIQNSFGGPTYNYTYRGYSTKFNTTISQLSFKNGEVVGYDGSIVDKYSNCSFFMPTQLLKGTYLTAEFLKNFWDDYSRTSQLQQLIYDSTNIQSDLFQFYLIDLENIIPNALNVFKKQLSKLNSICSIDFNIIDLSIDSSTNSLIININWKCNLVHTQTETVIINFQPNLKYKIVLNQLGNKLIVTTNKVELTQVKWMPIDDFPVVNQDLAQEYLKNILINFNNIQVAGTNFLQPVRRNSKFIFEDQAIFITDLAQQKKLIQI